MHEVETCSAGLGSGKHALGGWLGQVRLAINTLLVKKGRLVGIDEGKHALGGCLVRLG